MPTTVYRSCPLCEATCGVAIEIEGDRVLSVRGDDDDPFSKGYICPKGTALADLHHDPDRLTRPVRRDGDTWTEMSWDEAFEYVGKRLKGIRDSYGKDKGLPYAICAALSLIPYLGALIGIVALVFFIMYWI